jgi:hypothetical protein
MLGGGVATWCGLNEGRLLMQGSLFKQTGPTRSCVLKNIKKTGTNHFRAFSEFKKTETTGFARVFKKLRNRRPTEP